jgi:predicted dehydrogenase
MAIKIQQESLVELQAAIKQAAGRSTCRLVDAPDVLAAAARMDAWFKAHKVAKCLQAGTEIVVNGSERVANSYGSLPSATFVRIRRNSSGWRLVSVRRGYNRPLAKPMAKFPDSVTALDIPALDREFNRL